MTTADWGAEPFSNNLTKFPEELRTELFELQNELSLNGNKKFIYWHHDQPHMVFESKNNVLWFQKDVLSDKQPNEGFLYFTRALILYGKMTSDVVVEKNNNGDEVHFLEFSNGKKHRIFHKTSQEGKPYRIVAKVDYVTYQEHPELHYDPMFREFFCREKPQTKIRIPHILSKQRMR